MNKLVKLLLALSAIVAPAFAQADFAYPDFSSVAGLQLNGSAVQMGNLLRLTSNAFGQTGSAFTTQEITLGQSDSFSTSFQFQMTNATGIPDSDGQGGEGIVFVIQTVGDDVTDGGEGLGYESLKPSLGIEFDTYEDTGDDDPDGNHVGVDLNGDLRSIATATEPTRFNNGQVWNAWIDYDGSTHQLEVRWSLATVKPAAAQLTSTVNLSQILGRSTAFVGFTAATGDAALPNETNAQEQDILQWQFQSAFTSPGAPVITSATTAAGQTGAPFSYQITAANAPTSYEATGLPASLGVDAETGLISGVPTQTGTYSVTLSATNALGTGTETLTLTVGAQPVAAPVITSVRTVSAQAGAAFSYQVTATNAATAYGASGLPTGLNFNVNTGLISGTPAASGNFTIILSATNSAGIGSVTLTLTITELAGFPVIESVTGALAQLNVFFSYQIAAVNAPASYGASGLPTGLSVDTSTGLISGTPAQSGTFAINIWATNASGAGTATFTLVINLGPVSAPVIDSVTSSSAEVGAPFVYQITAGNAATSFGASGLPAGLTIDIATGLISGTPTAAGSVEITLSATNSGGTGSVTLTLTITATANDAPSISGGTSAIAQLGVTFTFQIVASGAPTSYSASGLPPGAMIDTATGVISGAATQLGTFRICLTATNASGTGTAAFVLVVTAISPPLISSSTSSTALVGTPFNYQISAGNQATSYSATGLPPGLSVDPATGIISGTPTQGGSFQIALSATNSGGTAEAVLILVITDDRPVVTLISSVSSVTAGSGGIGEFTVTLSPAQTAEVIVHYQIKGTAANGSDYVMLSGTKKFKPGRTSKPIRIQPLGDLGGADKKVVVLVLTADPSYQRATTGKVKVKIFGGP